MKRILFIIVLFLSAVSLGAQPITYAPQIVTVPGDVSTNISVPITVDNFTDVGAISLKLQYLTSVMTWVGYTENIVTGFFVLQPVPGEINMVWIPPTPAAAPAMANGSVLITLTFTLLSNATSPLLWLDPTGNECEYQQYSTGLPYNDVPQSTYYIDGWVSGLNLPPLTVVHPTCFGWTDGSVTAAPLYGTPPYSYTWSGPAANPGDVPSWTGLGDGTYLVTVTDFYGVTVNGSATLTHVNELPIVNNITLQANELVVGPAWTWPVNNAFPNFDMCIDPLLAGSYYMDVDAFTATEPLAVGVLNPFYLDQTSLPPTWLSYWAGKGVGTPPNAFAWQDQMWDIINGSEPFFYLKYTAGADYILVDGLQYWIGGGEPIVTVPGDYPEWTYQYTGTVESAPGCVSLPFDVFFEFNTVPVPALTGATYVCKNSTETYNTDPLMTNYVWVVNNATITLGGGLGDDFVTVMWDQASGTGSISVNYTDPDGCTAANPTVLNVQIDNVLPQITCPSNIAVDNDAGVCGAVVNYTAPVGTDDCPLPVTVQTMGLASGSVFPIGVTTNEFTVTDGAGNTAVCSFTVTVTDIEFPTITCPSNVTVGNDVGLCGAVVTFATPVGDDNCPSWVVAQTSGLVSGSLFPIGTSVVEFSVTDASNNTTTCSFSITVNDTEFPVIACPSNIAVNNDVSVCGATVSYTTPVGTDNCPGVTTTQTAGLASGSLFPIGTTVNTFEAEDASGNISTCSFSVTVTDAELPQILCPSDITVGNDAGVCGAIVNYATPVGTDNCPNPTTLQIGGLASGSSFPIGTTTNIFRVTDMYGNSSTCSFTVTVNDVEAPVITCPADMTVPTEAGVCGATVIWSTPAFSDNCAGATITQIAGPTSGNFLGTGTYTVTYEAEDAVGNTTLCSFDIFVEDQEDPVIICPVIAIPYNTDQGYCFAQLGFVVPATDNCPNPTVAYYINANPVTWPYNFPLGFTTVVVVATDASNNTSSCSFVIEVIDDQVPTVYPPIMAAFYNTDQGQCDATLMFFASATDLCDPNPALTYFIGASQIFFPYDFLPGTTTVTVVATDDAGNSASINFNVIVVDDQAPVITCPVPAASYFTDPGNCYYEGTFTATATDNCAATIVYTVNASVITFPYNFPVGTTTVVATATDAYNNSDDCSFDIIVIDNQLPVVTCPTPASMYSTDAGVCHASLTFAATVVENCAYTVVYSVNAVPISFPYNFPVGATTVDVLVTDASGNTDDCSFIVNVEDNEAPVISCPSVASSYTADAGVCGAQLSFVATATDNCGATVSYAIGASPISFPYFFPVGSTTVVATAVDANSNSVSCSFVVVVTDDENPVITCPVPASFYNADPGLCSASLSFAATATDNCSYTIAYTIGASPITFPYVFPVGSTTVTATATDPANNSNFCTFTVVVVDNQPPVLTVTGILPSYNLDPAACTTTLDLTSNASATDNCGYTITFSIGANPITFPYAFPIGTTVVTITATDPSNNTDVVNVNIVVVDNQAPVITCPIPAASYFADAGQCDATLTFTATAVDNCSYTIEYFVGASQITFPYDFPVGSTTVTAIATDLAMNSDACSFTVVVLDNQLPVITCPTLANPYNNDPTHCDATLNLPASVSDNCPNATIAYFVGVNQVTMPFTFPVGSTTVVAIATDANGNTAQCSYVVTVIDVEAPTVLCPSVAPSYNTDAGVCTSTQTFTAIPLDNCVATVSYSIGANTITMPHAFAAGVNTVVATATDLAGNTGTCTFVVTVIDVEAPVVTCPSVQPLGYPTDAGLCSASLSFTATAVDNCTSTSISYFIGATPITFPYVFPLGSTVVTATAMDMNSNSSSCNFTVLVIDNQGPVITCPTVAPSYNNTLGQCSANLSFTATSVDNCTNTIITYFDGATPISFPHTFAVGSTTVTAIATDANSNSSSCSFTVVVVDAQAPTFTVSGNNPESICLFNTYVDAGATATDNCDGNVSGSIVTVSTVNTSVVGSYTVTYTVSDASGNTATYVRVVNVISCGATVQGSYWYHNTANTPLNNVIVELIQGSTVMYSETTDVNGDYFFPYVVAGTYEVNSVTVKPTGGAINSLDAGTVNAWGTGPQYPIEKVRFITGDVIKDNNMDAGDAARINMYYLQLGNPTWAAPVELWSWWRANEITSTNGWTEGLNPTITVGLSPLTQDFLGMVTGDFNRSFIPGNAKPSASVSLNDGQTLLVEANTILTLPVIATQSMDLGAISLTLGYPEDKIEVLDVYLNNDPGQPIPFNVLNNQLRIGWFTNNSVTVNAGQAAFSLRVRVKTSVSKGDIMRFTLTPDPLNELGDALMSVISNAQLNVDVLEATTTGIVTPEGAPVSVSCYPNPFNGNATVNYTLPTDGFVTLEVYDLLGQRTAILISGQESAGSYTLPVDAGAWSTGVYMLRIKLETSTETLSRTIRIVNGK